MAFDGIITNKITEELQNTIGYKVDKIFQPNKNTIIVDLYKAGKNLSLLSCMSNNYRIHLTKHLYKNPTIAPNFCMLLRKHLIGFKIQNIYTYDLERIIFIDFENADNPDKPIYKKLIIELMGKHSNIILTNEKNIIIDSFKHTSIEENSQRDIYPTCKYILPENNKLNILNIKSFDNFYKIIEPILTKHNSINDLVKIITDNFNGLSTSFIKSLIDSTEHISKNNLNIIYSKIMQILNSTSNNLTFNTLYDKTGAIYDYVINLNNNYNINFNNHYNLNYFLDNYYFNKESVEIFTNRKNNLSNIVINTYRKYQKRIENMNAKLSECKNLEKYRIYGELITANLYQIPNKNTNSITLSNYYDNNTLITIPLDERYSPNYNSKLYFKRYSKLKNALEIVNSQKQETLKDIDYIESVIFEIENSSSLDDLIPIEEEIYDYTNNIFINNNTYKNKNSKQSKNTKNHNFKSSSFHPLEFTIEDYKIYVGRNNKENDYLTTKFANKNDLWFHTQDTHGSHVILKTHPNELIPENILHEAAKLAASHSKAKYSKGVLVDYCLVSQVKKPNSSKPGFVIYKNHKTLKI